MAVRSLHRCYAAFMITCCRISGLKKLTDRVYCKRRFERDTSEKGAEISGRTTKEIKRCMYEQSYSNSGIDFICDQSDPRTGRDPVLRKLKMGQTERVEGVQSHLKKAGTPTMGGVIILASVAVTSLIYVKITRRSFRFCSLPLGSD